MTDATPAPKRTTADLSLGRLQDVALWRGLQRELGLSERQLQVAIRLALGDSLCEIATRLGISPNTVASHYARLKERAHVRYRGDLIGRLYLCSGLLLGDEGQRGPD